MGRGASCRRGGVGGFSPDTQRSERLMAKSPWCLQRIGSTYRPACRVAGQIPARWRHVAGGVPRLPICMRRRHRTGRIRWSAKPGRSRHACREARALVRRQHDHTGQPENHNCPDATPRGMAIPAARTGSPTAPVRGSDVTVRGNTVKSFAFGRSADLAAPTSSPYVSQPPRCRNPGYACRGIPSATTTDIRSGRRPSRQRRRANIVAVTVSTGLPDVGGRRSDPPNHACGGKVEEVQKT